MMKYLGKSFLEVKLTAGGQGPRSLEEMTNGSGRIGRARDILRDVSIGHSVTVVQKLGKVKARSLLSAQCSPPLYAFSLCEDPCREIHKALIQISWLSVL